MLFRKNHKSNRGLPIQTKPLKVIVMWELDEKEGVLGETKEVHQPTSLFLDHKSRRRLRSVKEINWNVYS
jgi:hypothetical protein